jgi:hypothetical protein
MENKPLKLYKVYIRDFVSQSTEIVELTARSTKEVVAEVNKILRPTERLLHLDVIVK